MKKTLCAALAACLCVVCAAPAFADGDAEQFIVTVLKVEFKDVSGKWVKIAEPNRSADLLADDPLLQMTNKGSIPPGTYVNFRITLSETIQFSGSDGENKTMAGGILTLGGTAPKSSDMPRNDIRTFVQDAPTWNTASQGLVTEYLNLDYDKKYDDPKDPNQFFYRSDHYNYAKNGIPICFWFDGEHEDYHQLGDEVSKIDFAKMEKIARTIYLTGVTVANEAVRPPVDKALGR